MSDLHSSFRLLAIDTTGDNGSIALVTVSGVVEEVELCSPDGFAHVLIDEIDRLLAKHGLELGQLDGIAVTSGPGSFTGVRVGLTAAKGLAEATGRKVAAISNMEVLASFGSHRLRAAVMDARRGEIYGAVYDADLKAVQPEIVMKLGDWRKTVPAHAEFVTQGASLAESLMGTSVVQAPLAIAGALGKIGIKRFQAGLAQDPADVDANYVRRSDAELFWKED